MISKFALAAGVATVSGNTPPGYEYATDGTLCVGVRGKNEIKMGPKSGACTDDASGPSAYIEVAPRGLIFPKGGSTYLEGVSRYTDHIGEGEGADVYPSIEAKNTGAGFTDLAQGPVLSAFNHTNADGSKGVVGQFQSSVLLGNPDKDTDTTTDGVWAMVSTAHFIMNEGSAAFKTNRFRMPNRGAGDYKNGQEVEGGPDPGKAGLCVTSMTANATNKHGSGTCDGPDLVAKSGSHKWSLLAITGGDGYASHVTVNKYKGVGYRMFINTMGLGDFDSISLDYTPSKGNMKGKRMNENIKLGPMQGAGSGIKNIQRLFIFGAKGKLEIEFPQEYNEGVVKYDRGNAPCTVTSCAPGVYLTERRGKNDEMAINVMPSYGDDKDKGFMLDFVFPVDKALKARDGAIVYDPTISMSDASPAGGSSGGSSSGAVEKSVFGVLVATVTGALFAMV